MNIDDLKNFLLFRKRELEKKMLDLAENGITSAEPLVGRYAEICDILKKFNS